MADDRPVVRRLLTDPHVRAHLGGPVAEVDAEAALAATPGRRWGVFAVVRHADGALLGSVDLKLGRGEPEVSYTFLPEHWGQGYAREAVAAVLGWLPQQPMGAGTDSVIAITQAANARSRRLLASLGGVEEAYFQELGAEQVQVRLPVPLPGEARRCTSTS